MPQHQHQQQPQQQQPQEDQQSQTDVIEHDHCYARTTKQLWKLKRQKYMLTFKLCKMCAQELYNRKDDITECNDGGVDLNFHLCKHCTMLNMRLSDMNSVQFMAYQPRNNNYNTNNSNKNRNNKNNDNDENDIQNHFSYDNYGPTYCRGGPRNNYMPGKRKCFERIDMDDMN
ncbi:hypothetical protein niasHT_001312 [Heterodera trifolii]|uniref:Uncharacterized protein n=1 Tax=Heterodera trifolii TaxID=157864 RepID=A0ABD2LRK8_9BILA